MCRSVTGQRNTRGLIGASLMDASSTRVDFERSTVRVQTLGRQRPHRRNGDVKLAFALPMINSGNADSMALVQHARRLDQGKAADALSVGRGAGVREISPVAMGARRRRVVI